MDLREEIKRLREDCSYVGIAEACLAMAREEGMWNERQQRVIVPLDCVKKKAVGYAMRGVRAGERWSAYSHRGMVESGPHGLPMKAASINVPLPDYATEGSAGLDLYAYDPGTEDDEPSVIRIPSHGTKAVSTGLMAAIPEGHVGLVFARSGLAAEKGIRPANCVEVIDSDYRGLIIVLLHNDTDTTQYVPVGSRVAQMVIVKYERLTPFITDDLGRTERGEGGFGSTGGFRDDE